jgi:uncharacterized membrane protein YfcA
MWVNIVAGFGVGAIVGMTGVGGGALMTPILVLLFGVAPAAAVGTDLWFAAITKIAGSVVHHRQGSVDSEVLKRLCMGSLPASIVTLFWIRSNGGGKLDSDVLLTALGIVLFLTALAMVLKTRLQEVGRRLRVGSPDRFRHLQPPLTVIAGAILGVLVTLTSIGAGALGAVMLIYLYPLRMTPTRLVGTDIVHAVPLTIVAGTGHLLLGNVNFSLLGTLLLGSIPGIILGSLLSTRVPERGLRMAIAAMLTVAAVKLMN